LNNGPRVATYTGDYQLRNELRGPHALGGGPARQAWSYIAAATAAGTIATDGIGGTDRGKPSV